MIRKIPKRLIKALSSLPSGPYQEDLLAGRASWARSERWGSGYVRSRQALKERISATVAAHGWTCSWELHGKHEGKAGSGRPRRTLLLRSPDGGVFPWTGELYLPSTET